MRWRVFNETAALSKRGRSHERIEVKYRYLKHFPPSLNDGQHIFVFGSNLAGRHGKGAALEARRHWGAVDGSASGIWGHSYGVPTKDWQIKTLSLDRISRSVGQFKLFAHSARSLIFLVTPIGTGLAGYTHAEIAPMFRGSPSNCVFVPEWQEFLE